MAKRRIGLLGGSFNPAHDGHRFVSLQARKTLKLDEVWWLVSPQNPLKASRDMAPFAARLAEAKAVAAHPRIRVSDFERRAGTRYTIDTVIRLQRKFRSTQFVWIIGADNLLQMPHWRRWQQLFHRIPIAVYDRSPATYRARSGQAARFFRKNRCLPTPHLLARTPPAWSYIFGPRHPQSATAIRQYRSRNRNTSEKPEAPVTP